MKYTRLKKQLHFPKIQRYSISIILILIASVLVANEIQQIIHKRSKYNNQKYTYLLDEINNTIQKEGNDNLSKKENTLQIHLFDPNTVTKDSLLAMGIRESLASTWTKYTSKGGRFKNVEDLKNIYGMNDFIFDKIKDKVVIEKEENNKKPYTEYKKYKSTASYNKDSSYQNRIENSSFKNDTSYYDEYKKNMASKKSGMTENYIYNMNTTDSFELQTIKGIGSVLASRIIKYRESLGGYHDINQLLEVFGVKPALLGTIMYQLDFSGELRKIKINQVTVDELRAHPYFDYKTASIFINYRNHHYPYKGKDDIMKIKIIEENWLELALPYFSFEVDESETTVH